MSPSVTLLPSSPLPDPSALALPEQWFCERCVPRKVDALAARDRQTARRRTLELEGTDDTEDEVTVSRSQDKTKRRSESTSGTGDESDEPGRTVPLPGPSGLGNTHRKRRKSTSAAASMFPVQLGGPTSSSAFIGVSGLGTVTGAFTAASTAWGAPPPPRRASNAASSKPPPSSFPSTTTPSSSSKKPTRTPLTTSRTKKDGSSLSSDKGKAAQDKDAPFLFEPWATEYTHIQEDVVFDREVKEKIARWAQVLLDEEEEWAGPNPTSRNAPSSLGTTSEPGKSKERSRKTNLNKVATSGDTTFSPLTSSIPPHPFSSVYYSSPTALASSSATHSPLKPNLKVRLQVKSISHTDSNPLPSPAVCPVSPVVTPAARPLLSPSTPIASSSSIGFFESRGIGLSPSGGGGLGSAGGIGGATSSYARPPSYGLFTNCPTAHAQSQSSSSSTSNLQYYTTPIPAGTMLIPYVSCVGSLESYVRDRSSQYELLQVAKPFVRLVGSTASKPSPPVNSRLYQSTSSEWRRPRMRSKSSASLPSLKMDMDDSDSDASSSPSHSDHEEDDRSTIHEDDYTTGAEDEVNGGKVYDDDERGGLALALDAREMGNEARWARCGCFPNAVIRPVLGLVPSNSQSSSSTSTSSTSSTKLSKPKKGGEAKLGISWALFSTRPIAPRGEEIVLGWEWDRGSVVHRLKRILKNGCKDAKEE